jgi:hypothetical protein
MLEIGQGKYMRGLKICGVSVLKGCRKQGWDNISNETYNNRTEL